MLRMDLWNHCEGRISHWPDDFRKKYQHAEAILENIDDFHEVVAMFVQIRKGLSTSSWTIWGTERGVIKMNLWQIEINEPVTSYSDTFS